MRHLILTGHDRISEGMAAAAKLITGKDVKYYNAYLEGDRPFIDRMKEDIAALPEGDEVIIMTDLLGGSVNNESMMLLEHLQNVHLVTGTNLQLVIQLLFEDEGTDTAQMLRDAITEARGGMLYCNDMVAGIKTS